jgi:hypothetical protein
LTVGPFDIPDFKDLGDFTGWYMFELFFSGEQFGQGGSYSYRSESAPPEILALKYVYDVDRPTGPGYWLVLDN